MRAHVCMRVCVPHWQALALSQPIVDGSSCGLIESGTRPVSVASLRHRSKFLDFHIHNHSRSLIGYFLSVTFCDWLYSVPFTRFGAWSEWFSLRSKWFSFLWLKAKPYYWTYIECLQKILIAGQNVFDMAVLPIRLLDCTSIDVIERLSDHTLTSYSTPEAVITNMGWLRSLAFRSAKYL